MGATPSSEQDPLDVEVSASTQQGNDEATSDMPVESIPEELAAMPRPQQSQPEVSLEGLAEFLNVAAPQEIK